MKLDNQTLELPGLGELPKKRGRQATGKAKSGAQRMADLRRRRQIEVKQAHKSERRRSDAELVAALAVRFECDDIEGAKAAWLELGHRRGWKL